MVEVFQFSSCPKISTTMTENLSVEPEVKQVEPKVVAELSSKFVTNINVALYHTEVDIAGNFYKQNGKYYDPDGPWLDSVAKKGSTRSPNPCE